MTKSYDADDLRESVRDYLHNPHDQKTRAAIRNIWAEQGIPNQYAARVRAAEIDRAARAVGSSPTRED